MLIQQIGDNLEVLADNSKDDDLAALAYIKQAEVIRTDLHYRLDDPSEQEIAKQAGQAKELYDKAIASSAENPSLRGVAKLGIGLCEEELGNFDQARQTYEQIASDTGLAGTTAVAAAQHRLDSMDDFTQQITFPPAPAEPAGPALPDLGLQLDAPILQPQPEVETNVMPPLQVEPALPPETDTAAEPDPLDPME
jgi:tetratricopeptide (TPR) repeat protein